MNRRTFIAGALSLCGMSASKAASLTMRKKRDGVRFLAFADIHYQPGVWQHDDVAWLDRILDRARRERVDFVIHLGDMVHDVPGCAKYVEHYNDFEIPTYHVLGNHDNDASSLADTLSGYRMASGHYCFDLKGFRFVVLDPNYIRRPDGTFEHYARGNYYKCKWQEICWMPPEQVRWLEETLVSSPWPCVLFSHQSLERSYGGCVQNAVDVRAVIDRVNVTHPGRVRLAINGHHHRDFVRILSDVVYWDLNSANIAGAPGKGRHALYPVDYIKKHSCANATFSWNDPLSAVVTLDVDGLIDIRGQNSTWFMDASPLKCGASGCDGCGRPAQPSIQSFRLRMEYA